MSGETSLRRLALHQDHSDVVFLPRALGESTHRLEQDARQLGGGFPMVVADNGLNPLLSEVLVVCVAILVNAVREKEQDVARPHVQGHRRRQRWQAHGTEWKARGLVGRTRPARRPEMKDRPLAPAVEAYLVSGRIQEPDEGGDEAI